MKIIITTILFWLSAVNGMLIKAENQRIEIYSGKCTLYHKEWAGGNKVRYKKLGQSFGKLVLNRSNKHMNFFFNGKLVFSRDSFDSYVDEQQGGEGFTSYNGVDGHRFTAERVLQVNFTDPFTGRDELGYQYEITNYKVN